MSNLIATTNLTIVVGLGVTGLSAVRYLIAQGAAVMVVDTREQPPGLDELRREFPQVAYELGTLNEQTLLQAQTLVVSPGLSLQTPELVEIVPQASKLWVMLRCLCVSWPRVNRAHLW